MAVMRKIELGAQSGRTLIFCRSSDIEQAEEFVFDSLERVRAVLNDVAGVPFLAFCNLNSENFSLAEQSYIEAGYAVEAPLSVGEGMFCETKPLTRVLTCAISGEVESRSVIHSELLLYARLYEMKLENTVYEYYFLSPATGAEPDGECEKITVFAVCVI